MNKPLWAVPIIIISLVACGAGNTNSINQPSSNKPLGLLEVTLDFSDELNPTSTTNFKPFGASQNETRTISATGNESSQIKIARHSVGFIDDNETFGTKTRYVRGTFDIANFGARAFNNLNFMATSSSATKIGTMFSSLKDGGEVLISDTDTLPDGSRTYRALKPTHGMRSDGTDVVVDPKLADMQVFTPAESNAVQSALASTYPGIQVLEYGYTARNNTGSRGIPITPTSADCSSTLSTPPNIYTFVTNNASCFTGTVTFAFKFGRKAVRSQNPFVFSFVFVVSDESNYVATQSLEEQTSGTVAGLPSNSTPSRTLFGTTIGNPDLSNFMCGGIKTAVSSAALNTEDFLLAFPNVATLHNSLDLCGFGIAGKRNVAYGQDIYLRPDGGIWSIELNDGYVDYFLSNGKSGLGSHDVVSLPAPRNLYIRSNGDLGISGEAGWDASVCQVLTPVTNPLIRNCTYKEVKSSEFQDNYVNSTTLQPDGKIVVMGGKTNPLNTASQFNIGYLVRYSATGTPESTIGTGGVLSSGILVSPLSKGLAVQTDSKILIGGHVDSSAFSRIYDFALARYNNNGTLDSSFGTGGIAKASIVTPFLTNGSNNQVHDLIVQTDGKILAVGVSDGLAAAVRFLSNGQLDTTFGDFGLFTQLGTYLASFSGLTSGAADTVELQPDGKIVMAGSATYNGKQGVAIIRLNTNGTTDTSFGNAGLGFLDLGNLDPVNTIKFQADGKILVSTTSYIARYIP